MADDAFAHDRYLIDQLVKPMANVYRITPLAHGQTPAGPPVAFVRQKKLAIKEHIRFFADEAETQEVFRIRARSMLDMGGSRYDVTTPDEQPIGRLEHQFTRSLIRTAWKLVGADESVVATAIEKNAVLAVARRIVDFVPYGEFVPIPYDFVIRSEERDLGHFTRNFLGLRDRYVLDLSHDQERRLDRRLGIALGVGLDALQNR